MTLRNGSRPSESIQRRSATLITPTVSLGHHGGGQVVDAATTERLGDGGSTSSPASA